MKNFNKITLAKGIFYNNQTRLCIFKINQGKSNWVEVHLDNIEGKFYQGCPAKLYQYDNEILKAVILEPDEKKWKN